MSLDCHILVRSRHTYERFVWRYAENQGEAVKEDLIQHLVHIPPKEPTDEMAAASMTRDPRMLKLDPNEWKVSFDRLQPFYLCLAYRSKIIIWFLDLSTKEAARHLKISDKLVNDNIRFQL